MRLRSCVAGLALASFALLALPLYAKAAAPRLVLKERTHNFGAVQQGQILECALALTNEGDGPLTIEDVHPGCGCTTTGDWPHELKAGASAAIPVKIDTAHFVGMVAKTVTITSNDPTEPMINFEMRAEITTPVSIATRVLIFPAATDPNQSFARSTTIRSEVPEPLKLSPPHSDNPLFRPELKTIIPDKEYDLIVTTATPLPEGSHSARITMNSTVAEAPTVTVEAVITLLSPIQVAPHEIAFMQHVLANEEKRFAVIISRRDAGLALSDVTTNAPGVTIAIADAPDRKQSTITLTFPAGFSIDPQHAFALRGKTNQSALPTFEVPIVYSGPR